MKHSSRPIMAILSGLLLGLTGCGHDLFPAYSPSLKYPLRQDPILMQPAAKLGDERYDPDSPGQFPLMKFDDIFKPGNPLEPKADEIKKAGVLRDPTNLSAKDKSELEDALEKIFGTPAKPTVVGLEAETIKILQIDSDTLEKGSTRFRVHCLHCHGVSGDGRGPTARWINPHPRDFRSGMFKFQSVDQASDGQQRRPTRADLLRTLRNGLEGTAMPSFSLLEDRELDWIVSYVIHLSLRGEVELTTLKENFDFDSKSGMLAWKEDDEPQNPLAAVKQWTGIAARRWKESPEKPIKVAPYPYKDGDKEAWAASVKRGKQLFTGDEKSFGPRAKNANCVSCHTDFGRQAKFRFDDWGTLVRPNNFTAGNFRGGRRPVDMYYRIHSGINGSGMANFGSVLKGEEIWDLINFVSALPYPAMQKDMGVKAN